MVILGIDLGASSVTVALERSGTTVARRVERTPRTDGEAIAERLTSTVDAVCDSVGVPVSAVDGVGVGTMGPLDDTGVCNPPNCPAVTHIPIVDPLSRVTGAPVRMRNDAVAGVVGERDAGAPPNTVYLTLSSGVGAGACVDGHVLTGATGNAAEVGHFLVNPGGDLRCGCGATGHWEAYCGGDAIPRHTIHHHRTTGVETGLPLETEELDAATVLDAAGTDPLATSVTEAIAAYNAVGIAGLVHAYDPTTIVVGGAVARNHPETVVDAARTRVPAHVVDDVPTIELTALQNPVLAGAVVLGRRAASS